MHRGTGSCALRNRETQAAEDSRDCHVGFTLGAHAMWRESRRFARMSRTMLKSRPRSEPIVTPFPRQVTTHRTLFISDTHLGTRGCKARQLADFLTHNECETLYLVGDIIDGWQLKRGWYWDAHHTRVVDLIVRKAEGGTRVIYVPGNHDEMFRPWCGRAIMGVEMRMEDVHETADGRRLLILHGDRFDGIVTYAKGLAKVGAQAYGAVVRLNTVFNRARSRLGLPYWSLAAYLKHKVKNAGQFIARFERAVAAEANLRGFDGVVCGHIHSPAMKQVDGVLYCNDGDWVESCTALAEESSGRLSLIRWTDASAERGGAREAVSAAA
jgi:UDP-2,3-diacylglucosamine pyrophosphatase LpxH